MTAPQFIPDSVKNSDNPWHTIEVYKTAHYYSRDNNFFAVLGANGFGKTNLALKSGEDLAYDERNEPTLFNPNYLWEHVTFEKDELMKVIDALNKKPAHKVRGYVIIPDEVQDALNSKEAMKEEVRNISSYLATLRSRRYIIYFTLPSWNMLVKDARRIMNFAHLMTRRPTTVSFSDLRYVKTDRLSDEPRLWRPRRVNKIQDEFTGMSLYNRPKWTPLTYTMPSPKTLRIYRKLKLEAQNKKSTRLKEKMIRSAMDEKELKAEAKDKLKEFILTKIPSVNDAVKFIRQKSISGGETVDVINKTKLMNRLGFSKQSKRIEDVMDILCEEYPKAFSGVDW